MGKLKSFWSSVGSFFSKTFSFIINVLAMPSESTWSKGSSYALIVCNDYQREGYPVKAKEYMENIFKDSANTIDVLIEDEATPAEVLKHIEKGVKYKTFFFYIFCHGGRRSLFLCGKTLTAKSIWEAFRKSEGRIVGFFDACQSGSMLSDPDGVIRSPDGFEDERGNIADTIIELFKEQEMRARDGEATEEMPKTRLRLYSSSSADIPSYYIPGQTSLYAEAIQKTYLATDEKTTYAEFDPKLIENGKVHVNKPDYEWVIPEVATYGEDFSSYRLFR